jgi:hypothetical protein
LATFADLFRAFYRTTGSGIEFSAVRLHCTGADRLCRALGAAAITVGSDIYFREGAFAPHTPQGLRILAHEVAHVVQQRGRTDPPDVAADLAVGPAKAPEEDEADAAADALLAGRPFVFAALRYRAGVKPQRIARRYMAWEHCLLGDLDPVPVYQAAAAAGTARGRGRDAGRPGLEYIEKHCALLELLGRDPRNVDEERLRAEYPGLETVRLPGSGLVVTLGELNILPDYLAHPEEIEIAPAAFLEPLLQSVRTWSVAELRRSAGHRNPRRQMKGSMAYPRPRRLAEIREVAAVDGLGQRCGFAACDRYSSVLGRNGGHFAPFSWHRWQSFHLMARELIMRSRAAAGDDRENLRTRARIYAGYADHFLQDSYAAGHLINKTLVMQWYIDWLAESRFPNLGRHLPASMATSRQPWLHGPDHYDRMPAERDGPAVTPNLGSLTAPQDPQSVVDAPTLEDRIEASGVIGESDRERREAYADYLAMLGSSVAQFIVAVVHGYLNKRSLTVAAGADGPRFRLQGDRTLLASGEGALWAARAAAASRCAISELLDQGGTDITTREIFDRFPDHVEQDGVLIPLRQWQHSVLRDLCFGHLFGLWRTRATTSFISAVSPRFGVPSADVELLRS